ncbi:MAG: cytochrome c-type biogenesis protein CcmH [Acidobacteriota bacterium]
MQAVATPRAARMALTVIATLSLALAASAQQEWEPTYKRMITELMSPYCHGLTLADCPTQGAAELRDQVKAWLIDGRSEDWILDQLEAEYGPSILGVPRMSGIGILAWVVPPLFFVLGAIGVVIFLRRHGPACESGSAVP